MINSFRGPYLPLSNFYIASVKIGDDIYKSAEHAYQALKMAHPVDALLVCEAPTPRRAKELGNRYRARDDWGNIKLDMMKEVVRSKFECNQKLRSLLLSTKDQELVEGNTWGDTYWGAVNEVGENHLGRILMEVREELRIATTESETA